MPNDSQQLLQLLQLSDSALPIGAASHSFGLETLAAEEAVTVDDLADFFHGCLAETGALEAAFCRTAHRLAAVNQERFAAAWTALNFELSAYKPARESRAAGATLGRRFLQLAAQLQDSPRLYFALQTAKDAGADIHHSAAFGLVGGVLGIAEETTALAYLQQNITGLISACQRLMPLGQQRAGYLLWRLNPAIVSAAAQDTVDQAQCFMPMPEIAAMRHPGLMTRLFIS